MVIFLRHSFRPSDSDCRGLVKVEKPMKVMLEQTGCSGKSKRYPVGLIHRAWSDLVRAPFAEHH